jgi:hypothetical protein
MFMKKPLVYTLSCQLATNLAQVLQGHFHRLSLLKTKETGGMMSGVAVVFGKKGQREKKCLRWCESLSTWWKGELPACSSARDYR